MDHLQARAPAGRSALTRRENDVVSYLVTGKSNKYIAIELNISSRTAEAHRARIFRKMGVRNAMELACCMCPHSRCGG
jgi:DNA-binding NarL/FixJ family response regulator